jgi:hypothetical protein
MISKNGIDFLQRVQAAQTYQCPGLISDGYFDGGFTAAAASDKTYA